MNKLFVRWQDFLPYFKINRLNQLIFLQMKQNGGIILLENHVTVTANQLSDSMSAVQALCSVCHRSPTVILHLVKVLRDVHTRLDRLLFSCGNRSEWESWLIGKAWSFCHLSLWRYFPEGLSRLFQSSYAEDYDDWWNSCKYAQDSQYLDLHIYNWTWTGHEEVWLTRLRTLSLSTEYRLFKLRLRRSPVCDICDAGFGSEYHSKRAVAKLTKFLWVG